MKRIYLLLISVMMTTMCMAQVEDTDVKSGKLTEFNNQDIDIFNDPGIRPEYPGGPEGLIQFISKNIRYPKDAYALGIEGRMLVSYVITKDGEHVNIVPVMFDKCVATAGKSIPEVYLEREMADKNWKPKKQERYLQAVRDLMTESSRVISQLPKPTPAIKDGKPVAVKYTVPINFKIPKQERATSTANPMDFLNRRGF